MEETKKPTQQDEQMRMLKNAEGSLDKWDLICRSREAVMGSRT